MFPFEANTAVADGHDSPDACNSPVLDTNAVTETGRSVRCNGRHNSTPFSVKKEQIVKLYMYVQWGKQL